MVVGLEVAWHSSSRDNICMFRVSGAVSSDKLEVGYLNNCQHTKLLNKIGPSNPFVDRSS